MKYRIKYACGHEGDIDLTGPTRERERKLEWYATCSCKECQEMERKKATEEMTKELGLPDLQGTEKQIDWAARIRINEIRDLGEYVDRIKERIDSLVERLARAEEKGNVEMAEKRKANLEYWRKRLPVVIETYDGISAITEAHWWIEHRENTADQLIEAYQKRKDSETEEAIAAETAPEMVVMEPDQKQTSTVCTLTATDSAVILRCDRDEHIRLKVKAHGFTWDGEKRAWIKPITEMTGDAKDLAPDTARILLKAGIPVKSYPSVQKAVESDSYEHETARWISRSTKDSEKLFIRKVDGVYLPDECKTTYNGDGIISPTLWREIREFAELNGYRITKAAEEMLRKAEEATVSVRLPDGTTVQPSTDDMLKAVLESSRDVLEDLKDEED